MSECEVEWQVGCENGQQNKEQKFCYKIECQPSVALGLW